MIDRSSSRRTAAGLVVALLVGVSVAESGAGRTRPGGGSGGGGGAPPPQPVSGHATYGHYGHGHYPGHGYYGYYGGYYYPYAPWWGFYGYVGWPWGGWYAGWPYTVAANVDPEHAPAGLETDVEPGKADVQLDGQHVGQARDFNGRWDLLWLSPGEHVVEFSREGYQTLQLSVEVQAGGYVKLQEKLQKGSGVDPRSSVATANQSPDTAPEVKPSAGPTAEEPRAEPLLRRGLLRLVVQPPDAAVYLDGEFLARADELARLRGALPVAQGQHVIEVVRPGYESRAVRVDVGSGDPASVQIELEPETRARD